MSYQWFDGWYQTLDQDNMKHMSMARDLLVGIRVNKQMDIQSKMKRETLFSPGIGLCLRNIDKEPLQKLLKAVFEGYSYTK
mmetsp:Transcript_25017/g.24754  ORF Transcript_25017/g.24754 Transcript_25017/m.24754 type:complete len:81 (+) Transcript_25017:383-625(+)|eukprot:CAMPEP_0197013122 /NCGR_PEP_ID=MMETSP1380-20130617/65127_1 /TAXON_ID=5936 /ORGANISM="Euplotes crassus, Strain CT5" /LENGTH=80 /DNA_ID=CAMNT_0042437135 /DNA_START=364 /DNA_END=606 /DNA_ORIENTATION=-